MRPGVARFSFSDLLSYAENRAEGCFGGLGRVGRSRRSQPIVGVAKKYRKVARWRGGLGKAALAFLRSRKKAEVPKIRFTHVNHFTYVEHFTQVNRFTHVYHFTYVEC